MIPQLAPHSSRTRPWLLVLTLAVLGINALGCAQFVALFRDPDGKREVQVKAQYEKLTNQHVAVLVSASDKTLVNYPKARPALTRSMSQRLASNVKGITLMNPSEILDFQAEHQYWNTLPYSQLIDRLGVDVIVLVDVVDYQTNEPGNRHEFRGIINANVNVIDADANDTDKLVWETQVDVTYPRDRQVPIIERDQQTVETRTVDLFTRRAAGLFYDHTERR